jgi:hypothetical protein
VYVILAITKNVAGDPTIFAETKILFWDSYSTHWLREYPISDPFIHSIEKTPIGIFAHGVTGIWQISFGGVKKVLSHSPGIYTVSGANVIHYGRATSFFSNSILWGGTGSGTARVINSWGELDSSFPSAHLQPVLSTPNKNITMVSGQLSKGYVFVADSTPQLFYYPVGSGTPATGLSAQTVYFQLGSKYNIEKVKVVFGEPLVSGDSMSIQFKTDEDASVTPTTALTATYATDGAVRSKNVRVAKFVADEQLSLVINFTAGAVKIKRIEVFGSLVPEV